MTARQASKDGENLTDQERTTLKEFFAARKKDLLLGALLVPLLALQVGLEWLEKELKGRLAQR